MQRPTPHEARHLAQLLEQGALQQLALAAQPLTTRYPNDALGWWMLGTALHGLGQAAEAEANFRRALTAQPDHLQAWLQLARLQAQMRRLEEAEASYLAALRIQPQLPNAWLSLAVLYSWQEQWAETEHAARQAIAQGAKTPVAFDVLRLALLEQGRAAEALACSDEALSLWPDSPTALSHRLLVANYVPQPLSHAPSPGAQRFAQVVESAAGPGFQRWDCERGPQRLRVGIVSADLRDHAVARFLPSTLDHAAHHGIDFHAYTTNLVEDAVSAQLKPKFRAWRALSGATAADAALIHADRLHVLIDLSGHTGHNRLDVFAHRPAPVQLSWLGSIATTGLNRMDYVLADRHASLPDDASRFSERIWRLPDAWACYDPPQALPAVGDLPASRNGFVTFGSFNNLTKIGDQVIGLWAEVLRAVPGSRLFLKSRQLRQEASRARLARRFADQGITADRLDLEGPTPGAASHLAAYNRIDIGLDPFPYTGCTTSVEACCMGVPIVTLRGDGSLLRLNETIARNLGAGDWIAATPADYVARAAAAASDLTALAGLRRALRPRMEATSLLDAQRFGAQFAEALWGMWRAAAPANSGQQVP
jgi:predicted O-linked N-acetylglucosamine transferase (SPINDLY family)